MHIITKIDIINKNVLRATASMAGFYYDGNIRVKC